MTVVLIAAVLVGLAAPVIRGWMWGVPFSLLSIATVLRSFLGSALTVLVVGVGAFFALRATSMPDDRVDGVAGLMGLALGVLLLLSSAQRLRDVRGLSILCQRLQEEDARPTAAAALGRLLDRMRRKDVRRYVPLVLMATGPLTQANMWSEARDRLRSLDDDLLSEPQSTLRNQALATCELQFDDLGAAQRAIDRIQRPTESSIEVWLVAMEALLLALRGEPEEALARIGRQDAENNPSLRASHRLVHAHILAERGDVEAALEELRSLKSEAGGAGLRRAMLPSGPASPLAKQLLDEAVSSAER